MDELYRLVDTVTLDAFIRDLKAINTDLARLEARLSAVERTLGAFAARLEADAEAHAQGHPRLRRDP